MDAAEQITEELAHAGEPSRYSPLIMRLEANRITSDKVLPPMEFMLRLFDEPCFPRRELVAVTGRAKSGKTFIVSMIMTCCITRQVLQFRRDGCQQEGPPGGADGESLQPPPLRVLWYDTEQSDNSTQDILKNRIIPLYHREAGYDVPFPEEMLDIFNVRNIDRKFRESYFLEAIKHYRPDLVILDGIRDLVADINDGVAAQEMMEKLMMTAQQYDCCIVCVLHQNKSGDSRDPRGWLGTELLNKAYDVFTTEKIMPQRIFKLEQLYTRKYDIEQPLFFKVGEDGLPVSADAPPMPAYQSQNGANDSEHPTLNDDYIIHHPDGRWEMDVSRLFTDALQGHETLTGIALRYAVMQLGNIASRSFYNNCLNKAMEADLMVKSHDNQNRVIYRLNIPVQKQPSAIQQELWENTPPK